MAITNLQQARQMYAMGQRVGRIAFGGGGSYVTGAGAGKYQGGSGVAGSAESKTMGGSGSTYSSPSDHNENYGVNLTATDPGGYVSDKNPTGTLTSADYERGRNQFIDNLNRNNAARFQPNFFQRTYKPVTLDTVGARNQKTGLNQGLATLLGFATGMPFNLLTQGKKGLPSLNNKITNIRDKINNFQGNFRQKFTGYRTQAEYDAARQNRINLDRINTIQNTLDTKYADGDYSDTDLDERLADLKQSMGILDVATVNQINDNSGTTKSDLNNISSLIKASEQSQVIPGVPPENEWMLYNRGVQEQPQEIMDLDEIGYPSNDLMAFAPNSKRDRALKNLYSGYENLGIKDPQMIDLMQQDLQENQEKGTPLSLPQNAYSLIG